MTGGKWRAGTSRLVKGGAGQMACRYKILKSCPRIFRNFVISFVYHFEDRKKI